MSPDGAGEFFKELLTAFGEAIDDRDAARLIDHAYSWQVRAYAHEPAPSYEDAPFTKLAKAIAQSRLMLISSGGHFVAGDDPKPFGVEDMSQQEAMTRILDFLRAAPVLSPIPIDTPAERLRLRHGGYDIRGAAKDHNVILPDDRLRELRDEGMIGDLADLDALLRSKVRMLGRSRRRRAGGRRDLARGAAGRRARARHRRCFGCAPQSEGQVRRAGHLLSKGWLRWIDATKRRPEVRATRIAEMVELLEVGHRQRP